MPSVSVRDANFNSSTVATLQDANSNHMGIVSLDSTRPTYRASASFTPFATSAVTVLSIQGSATKTVRVKRIEVSGVSTANATVIMRLIRTSTTGTGGTAVAPTIAKLDTGSPAATAVVNHYTTAAQSSGTTTGFGNITTHRLYTSVVTTPTVVPLRSMVFPEWGTTAGQALVLRGASEWLEYQLVGGGNLSAGTVLEYVIEFEEDAS